MFDPHTYVGGKQIRHQCVGRCLSSEQALKTEKKPQKHTKKKTQKPKTLKTVLFKEQ